MKTLKHILAATTLLVTLGFASEANAQVPLENFFKNPEKAGYQISPDGKYFSYMAPYENRLNLFVQEVGSDKATRITSETVRDLAGSMWANGHRILYIKDTAGDENFQLYGVNVDSTDFGVAGGSSIFKTSQSEIFSRLIKELQEAMDNLEEKKNESLRDVNDFFFVSRDVARILLADIYMYQGNYLQAESLLAKVISGGFYMLDSSNYNQKETITDLYNKGRGTETILAVRNGVMTRSNISLGVPSLVPLMTYTDVLLSYAECLCKNGRTSDAEIQLNKLVTAKELQLSGPTVLDKIKSARLQLTLYCDVNFAFLKRTGLAKEVYGVENYRLLLPIPQRDVIAGGISQNTGY